MCGMSLLRSFLKEMGLQNDEQLDNSLSSPLLYNIAQYHYLFHVLLSFAYFLSHVSFLAVNPRNSSLGENIFKLVGGAEGDCFDPRMSGTI